MSLAVLARKTREKHRSKKRGFVLNMTAKQACCGIQTTNNCCTYPNGRVPASQMGYGVYLSRKSNGASRPSGVRCCNVGKSKTTFKTLTTNSSSDIIREKKDKTLACYNDTRTNISSNASYANKQINITVAAKTSSHPKNGVGSGKGYLLDGLESPVLKLFRGHTYRFKQNDTTNINHPIQFWRKEDKSGTQYTSLIVITAGDAGAYVDFTVPNNAPNKIYYQCGNHAYMGHYFEIVDKSCTFHKNICGCNSTDTVSYLRINHPKCTVTKDICLSHSAGEQVILKRGNAVCNKKSNNLYETSLPRPLGATQTHSAFVECVCPE